jgi:DNA repair protein RecO (recombination protein O)
MQWTDEGVIIGTRRHGETSLIVELMTLDHGRHLGLVRGGRSRRVLPSLQIGNSVSVTWRARLHEHLGAFAIEVTQPRAARLIEGPAALYAVQSLAALLRLLPERDPHTALYEALCAILDLPDGPLLAAAMIVRFEVKLLDDLGFGLDLESCAGGGEGDLIYVSPKSGRAVSQAAGEPYGDRLLALPGFLLAAPSANVPAVRDILAGFDLTGYFLARHVIEPRGLGPQDARAALVALVERQR